MKVLLDSKAQSVLPVPRGRKDYKVWQVHRERKVIRAQLVRKEIKVFKESQALRVLLDQQEISV